MLKNIKIRGKFLLFIVPTIVVIVALLFGMRYVASYTASEMETALADELNVSTSALLTADRDLYQAFLASNNLFRCKNVLTTGEKTENIDNFNSGCDDALASINRASATVSMDSELYNSLTLNELHALNGVSEEGNDYTYAEMETQVISGLSTFRTSFDPETQEGSFSGQTEAFEEVRVTLGIMEDFMDEYSTYRIAQINKTINATVASISLIAVIAGAFVIVIAIAISSAIRHGVHITNKNLDNLAKGDLSKEPKPRKGRDEIATMEKSITSVIKSLREILNNIIETSDQMGAFSKEFTDSFEKISDNIENMSNSVEGIANGATSQASSTVEANDKVIEIGNVIDETRSNVSSLNESSELMRKVSTSAESTLNELVEINKSTTEKVSGVKEQTNLTNQSANGIRTAVDMITSIANQTNLLSLNASIEAARAGEAGRGFAVVADEIRNLASQSTESAQTIEDIVKELLDNSEISVNEMDSVSEVISAQNEKLLNVKELFDSLLKEINKVHSEIASIERNTDELNELKNKVLSAIESLAAIAEENAASTEETSAQMHLLSDVVDNCNQKTEELLSLSSELHKNTAKFTLK